MTPARQTRAQRLAMPLARHVVRDLAAEHGACIRPVQLRRTDLDTGQVEQVLVPCGHTLATVCPACTDRVRSTVVGFYVVGVQSVEEFPDRPLGSEHVKGHMLTVLRNDFVFARRL